jgi:hypothetical protein
LGTISAGERSAITYIEAMPTESTLLLFSGVALALLLVPGPAVIYIVTTAATRGKRAGLLSVAGIHAGTLVHIGAAVAGLSAIIVASATAFTVVKLAGALYLVVVGVRMLLGHSDDGETPAARDALAGEHVHERLRRQRPQSEDCRVLAPLYLSSSRWVPGTRRPNCSSSVWPSSGSVSSPTVSTPWGRVR